MAKRKHRSPASAQRALVKKLAKEPFGPWEERSFPIDHPMRPKFERNSGEQWRAGAYLNNRYSVQLSDVETSIGPVVHIWVRRHDDKPVRSWRELQRIKDELIGEDRVAVEVFPAKSNIVDEANMYHLWVLPEDYILPFTLRGLPDG